MLLNKVTRVLVSFALLFQGVSGYFVEASDSSISPKSNATPWISVPSSLGFIRQTVGLSDVSSEKLPAKLIIHLQDAHCHFEAQKNSAKILKKILNQIKSPSLIEVEGNAGSLNVSLLSSFPDAKLRGEIAEALLRMGKIGGAEYLAMMQPETTGKVYGPETLSLYFTHLNYFRENLRERENVLEILDLISEKLKKIEKSKETQALKEVRIAFSRFSSGRVSLDQYVAFLIQKAGTFQVSLDSSVNIQRFNEANEMSDKIDFPAIQKEHQSLIDHISKKADHDALAEVLSKTMYYRLEKMTPFAYFSWLKHFAQSKDLDFSLYANLEGYLAYLSFFEEIDKEKLFEELGTLRRQMRDKLASPVHLSALYENMDFLELLRKFHLLEVSREEHAEYQKHKNKFSMTEITDFIRNYSDVVSPVDLKQDEMAGIAAGSAVAEKFYETAEQRDKALVENTLKQMDGEKVQVGVLVAGGYHTAGILDQLKKQNIPCIVIAPRITDIHAKTPYLSMMMNERSVLESSFEKSVSKKESQAKANAKDMQLAVMSAVQDGAVLQAFALEEGLAPDVKRMVLDLLKSMSLGNMLIGAYAEILLVVQGFDDGKEPDSDALRLSIQSVYSKWAEMYLSYARSAGLSGADLDEKAAEFSQVEKGIEVVNVEKIGNRLFLMLHISGEYRGFVIDPGLKGQKLIAALNKFELLELKDLALLKKAQVLARSILDSHKTARWKDLVHASPDLARLTAILKKAPFRLIEVERVFEVGESTTEQGLRLRQMILDEHLPAAKRIRAAADLLLAIRDNEGLQPLKKDVEEFLFHLNRKFLLVEHILGPHFYMDPAVINPLKNLYDALPLDSVERHVIDNMIRVIQMGFIRLGDQALIAPRQPLPLRFNQLCETAGQVLSKVSSENRSMLVLNDRYYALQLDAFKRALEAAPRVLVDEDFELSIAQTLNRKIHPSSDVQIIGASDLLETYLATHEHLGEVLFDKSGNVVWASTPLDPTSLIVREVGEIKTAFLTHYDAIRDGEEEQQLADTDWTIQKVSLTLPHIEKDLKNNPKFSVQERKGLEIPKTPAAVRVYLKQGESLDKGSKKILDEIRQIGEQTPDGGIFIYVLDAETEPVYWVFQRVRNELNLVDGSKDSDAYARTLGLSRHIVLQRMALNASDAGILGAAATVLGNPAIPVLSNSGPLRKVLRTVADKLSFLIRPFSSLGKLWTILRKNISDRWAAFKSQSGGFRWKWSPRLAGVLLASFISLGIAGKALAQETSTETAAPPPLVTNPEMPPLVPRFGSLLLRPPEPSSSPYSEYSASTIFNQGFDYRFRLDSRFSRAWTFNALWARSGLMNDTLDPEVLRLIENNAALLGLATGYIGPWEYARANRLLPTGSNLGRIQFLYEQPGGPFWMDFNLGVSYFDVPRLRGDRYVMRQEDVSPFGGIDLGLRGRIFDRPWATVRDEAELGLNYQPVVRDRLLNPEGVGSTHFTNRLWADFRLWDGRLVLSPFLESGIDIQPLLNAYIEGAMTPDGLTNDGIARRVVIPWATRRAGLTAFPFDDRGGRPNLDLEPTDLLGALDLYNHAGVQFRMPPAIWQRLEGRVRFQPWNFMEIRFDGGVDLTWRPQVNFMLRDIPENLESSYLKDNWELGFYAIPYIRPGITGVLFRDLRADVDFEGRWVSDLPLSARVTTRLRWQPRWIPGTELDVFYRYSNYSDPFGTVQNFTESDWHSFGLTVKVRHSPIGSGDKGKTVASVKRNKDGTVDVETVDEAQGGPKQNWLRKLYEGAKFRLVQPWIEKTLDKFKQRYPLVDLEKFKLFLSNSQRLGSIIHSDDSDQEIHLHQSLFHPWRFIWSKVSSIFGGGKDLEKWSELAIFTLAHEAIRHPMVDIDHGDFMIYSKAISPSLREYYERSKPEIQERLREFIEELVVIHGDIADDFLPSKTNRQQAILDALAEAEPKGPGGTQFYRDLLSRSRGMDPAEYHEQIFNFLMKDTRFAATLTPDLYKEFVKFAQFLSQKWVITGPGLEAARQKKGKPAGMTRREMTMASLKALGAVGVAMLLKACGVPDETWNLQRLEVVTVEEETGTGGVSLVEGAFVSVQPNTVAARLTVDPNPEHTRGGLQPYILTMDPSLESNPSRRNAQLFIHLAVSEERGDIIFPESGNLNQFENFDVEMVTNGIPFTLLFVDDNGSFYEIPIHISNADPDLMYRITIKNLLQALDVNGLVPADTDVFVTVPATAHPFTFMIFTGAHPTVPMLTGKTGERVKEVGRGLIEGEKFTFVESANLDFQKARAYMDKINAALAVLKRFGKLSSVPLPVRLMQDSGHFLDFTKHLGIDTDFFEQGYSPEFLALLLNHEQAHAQGGTERDAILSNSEMYDLMKSELGEFVSDELKAQHPYLSLLDKMSGQAEKEKIRLTDEFIQTFPELFFNPPKNKMREAAEIVSRIWDNDILRKKWEIREDFVAALKEKLEKERYAQDMGLFTDASDRKLLEIIEVLVANENMDIRGLLALSSQLIQAGLGNRSISADAFSKAQLDLAVLLGQFYGYVRGSYVSDHFLRTSLASEDLAETGSKRLYDIIQDAAAEADQEVSAPRNLRLASDGSVSVNGQPLKNISAGLKAGISDFVKRYGQEGAGLSIDFGEMPFSQGRLKLVLASILNNADRLYQNLTFYSFPDGSLVQSSLEENVLKLKVIPQHQRWTQKYAAVSEKMWGRVASHLKTEEAGITPPVKMIVLGSDSLAAQVERQKDQWRISLDGSRFEELYAQTKNIPHPVVSGSAVKWVIPVIVEGKVSDADKREIEKSFMAALLASHPEWQNEAPENIMIRVIQDGEEESGEKMIAEAEEKFLKGAVKLDRSKDLMLILSEREKEKLTLKDVLPWVIQGTLDEKKLMLIAELLAADGDKNKLSKEIIGLIKEIDADTLTELNQRQLFDAKPLTEQLQLQQQSRKLLESMA